jgi:uncharacterized membrane protein HdeD (DUF308 family)
MFKKYRLIPAILAAICFVCGVVLVFNSGAASRVIFKILGVLLLASGCMRLADEYVLTKTFADMSRPVLIRGIAEVVAAIILIFFTGLVLNFISFVVGLALLIGSGLMIYQAVVSSTKGTPGWWTMLVICIAVAIFALVMTFGGINAVGLIIRVGGLALAIYGGRELWVIYKAGQLF